MLKRGVIISTPFDGVIIKAGANEFRLGLAPRTGMAALQDQALNAESGAMIAPCEVVREGEPKGRRAPRRNRG